MYVPHLIIYLSVSEYLDWFHVLAIVNSAVINIELHVIFSNYGFLQICAQEWNCWIIWYFCLFLFFLGYLGNFILSLSS